MRPGADDLAGSGETVLDAAGYRGLQRHVGNGGFDLADLRLGNLDRGLGVLNRGFSGLQRRA